ncbi:ANK_REP_REGION domain-containing protein [Trichonephila clavata]|uniref:Alpha-latrotoxin n=1 Tax=Trichonephila clavata TaxID=2740835 RepID=A0A8X6LAA7_TRICU|nr:ANK_REP_REGION domain-containing protein [Trichonephila clavata]
MAFYIRRQRKIDETFLNYIKNGNPDPCMVREMIAQGANVNSRDIYCNTVLHLAMRHCYNKLAVVSVLLKAGANPNKINAVKKTPLRMAIKYGQDMPVISELIKSGANINFLDKKDNSPLHFAVAHFRQPVVDAFLKLKADVNVKNCHGNNVLHQCVLCHNLHTIRKILQSKDYTADIDAKNNDDETPLMLAVKSGDYEIVKELLSFGASVLIPDKHGSSLLHAALKKPYPNLNLIGELVRYDADICRYDVHSSPLHLALDRYYSQPSDELETAKTLLIYDALRNSDRTDWCKSNIGSKYGDILPELLEFYKKCLNEVKKMKLELIHKNYSFLEFVIQGLSSKALFQKRTIYKTFTVNQILHICNEYPIYRNIIACRLEKINLRRKLMDINVYVKKENEECKVFLDLDSVFTLSHYLTNLDLLNLIEAFSDLQAPCQDFGYLTLTSRKPEKRKYESDD